MPSLARRRRSLQPRFSPLTYKPSLWLMANAGLLTDGAASFASASSQYLSVASNSGLQIGNNDAWQAAWVKATTLPAGVPTVAGKWAGGGVNREYVLYYNATSSRFEVTVRNGANSASGVATANTFGAPTTGVWYFLMWYHDFVNSTLAISVNGGAFDAISFSGGIQTGTAAYGLGAYDTGPTDFWNGSLDSVAFGKSPPGGINAIATTIRDALYNSGSGIRSRNLTPAQKTAWGGVSYWDFDSAAGLLTDSWGTNTLTNNNAVTYAAGIASGPVTNDGDPIATALDWSGYANHRTQATGTKRPLAKMGVRNGLPVMRFDGVDDWLSGNSLNLGAGSFTVFSVRKGAGLVWGDTSTSSATPLLYELQGASSATFDHRDDGGTELGGGSFTVSGSSGTWCVSSFLRNGNAYDARMNGGVSTTATQTIGTTTTNAFSLGVLKRTSDGSFFTGDMAELLVYPYWMASVQRQLVEAYLNFKWSLY